MGYVLQPFLNNSGHSNFESITFSGTTQILAVTMAMDLLDLLIIYSQQHVINSHLEHQEDI